MAIQSVKRATDIISLFSSSQPALGITQIAAALGLNKATAWGLVTTLEKQGFLQQDPETLKYGIGSKLFELGMVYFSNLEINAKSSRLAQGLARRIARQGSDVLGDEVVEAGHQESSFVSRRRASGPPRFPATASCSWGKPKGLCAEPASAP